MPFGIDEGIALFGAALGFKGSQDALRAARETSDAIRDAADQAAAVKMHLDEPWLKAGEFALPLLQSITGNVLAPEMNKPNRFLAGQHKENLAGIGRTTKANQAQSALYWGRTAGAGSSKARGEQMGIANEGTRAKSAENLGYGMVETQDRDSRINRMLSTLSGMSGAGQYGVGLASDAADTTMRGATTAAQVRLGGAQDFGQDLGALGGMFVAPWIAKRSAGMFGGAADLPTMKDLEGQMSDWDYEQWRKKYAKKAG